MKKIWIYVAMAALLATGTGCTPPVYTYVPNRPDIVEIGDSNCTPVQMAFGELPWVIAGIAGDCKRGRKLINVRSLPNKTVIFLALGVNDAWKGVDPTVYGEHLTMLLGTTNADVYCVLPVVKEDRTAVRVDDHRQEMLNRCTNVIDPYELGVTVNRRDGIHWDVQDERLLGYEFKRILEMYPL